MQHNTQPRRHGEIKYMRSEENAEEVKKRES